MFRTTVFYLFFLLFSLPLIGQKTTPVFFNPGFEKVNSTGNWALGWLKWGAGYHMTVDTVEKHSGRYALKIESLDRKSREFGSAIHAVPAEYPGARVELKGWIKLEKVTDGYAGLLLRIDGDKGTLASIDMLPEQLSGTTGWQQYTISLPLPVNARRIMVGAVLTGKGTIWADDLELSVDGKSIPGTAPGN